MRYNALALLLLLLGCEAKLPDTICKDGVIYYQSGDSKRVYIQGSSTCIDIEEGNNE